MTYVLAFASILLGAFGQFLLKIGADKLQISREIWALVWEFVTTRELVLGLVCFVTSFLIWIAVLRKMEVSVAYPMVSLNYVIVTLLAVTILHEQWNLAKLVSLILITSGVLVLSLSNVQR